MATRTAFQAEMAVAGPPGPMATAFFMQYIPAVRHTPATTGTMSMTVDVPERLAVKAPV